jgi:hypothetical protein
MTTLISFMVFTRLDSERSRSVSVPALRSGSFRPETSGHQKGDPVQEDSSGV